MSVRIPIGAINQGWSVLAARLCVCLVVWAGLPGPASSAPSDEHKRVLILHSFGRDFRPWGLYARTIRQELDHLSSWHLDIQDHSLITARSGDENPGVRKRGEVFNDVLETFERIGKYKIFGVYIG